MDKPTEGLQLGDCAVTMTLRDFLLDRYAPLHQLSARTVDLYESTLDRFGEHLGREPTIDDLDDLVVSKFLQARCGKVLANGKPISRHSVKKDRTQLCAIWQLAARKRLLRSDGEMVDFPALPAFRTPERQPEGYLLEEVQRLIEDCDNLNAGTVGTKRPVPRQWFFRTLLSVLWQTAGRIGETTAVTWDDVDETRCVIRFRAETRKKQTRDIERQITPDLMQLLCKYRGQPGEKVWDWDRHLTNLFCHLQRRCEVLGIKCRGYHGFRKASASYYAAAGGAAHELLDHHDHGDLARKHYLDPRIVGGGPNPLDLLPKINVTGSAS